MPYLPCLRQCHKTRKSDCYVIDNKYVMKRFIDRSENNFAPIRLFESVSGITKLWVIITIRKWLRSSMILFIPGENSWKISSRSERKFSNDLKTRRIRSQIKKSPKNDCLYHHTSCCLSMMRCPRE